MIELQHHNYDGFSSEDKAKLNDMARERDEYVHQALFDLHRIQCLYGNARVNKHCKLHNTTYQQIKEEFTNTSEYDDSGKNYNGVVKLHARPSQCVLEPKHTNIINLLKEKKLRAIAQQIPHEYRQQELEEEQEEQLLLTNKAHQNKNQHQEQQDEDETMQRITDGQVNIDKSNDKQQHQHHFLQHIESNGEKENRLSNGHVANGHSSEEHYGLFISTEWNNNKNQNKSKAVNTENQINGYSHEEGQMVEYNTKLNNNHKAISRKENTNNNINDEDCHTNFVIPVHQPLPLSYETQVMLCKINHQPRPGYLPHVESTLSALFSRAHCVSREEARKELNFLQSTKHVKENDAYSGMLHGRKVNTQPWWSSSPSYYSQPELHRKGKLNLHMKVSKDFVPRCATQHTASYESFMYGRRM